MPVTRTCTFCGNDIEPGTGKMYVRKDGTVHFFCSHKCQANQLDLGRIGRRVRWTRRYVKAVEVTPRRPAPAPEAVVKEVLEPPEVPAEAPEDREAVLEALGRLPGVGPATAEALWDAGFTSLEALRAAEEGDLTEVKGIGPATARKLLSHLKEGS